MTDVIGIFKVNVVYSKNDKTDDFVALVKDKNGVGHIYKCDKNGDNIVYEDIKNKVRIPGEFKDCDIDIKKSIDTNKLVVKLPKNSISSNNGYVTQVFNGKTETYITNNINNSDSQLIKDFAGYNGFTVDEINYLSHPGAQYVQETVVKKTWYNLNYTETEDKTVYYRDNHPAPSTFSSKMSDTCEDSYYGEIVRSAYKDFDYNKDGNQDKVQKTMTMSSDKSGPTISVYRTAYLEPLKIIKQSPPSVSPSTQYDKTKPTVSSNEANVSPSENPKSTPKSQSTWTFSCNRAMSPQDVIKQAPNINVDTTSLLIGNNVSNLMKLNSDIQLNSRGNFPPNTVIKLVDYKSKYE